MTHKEKTVDKILANLTIKMLPNTKGVPNYKDIKKMMQLLYNNMATLTVTQGGGYHGNIGIIMNTTLYTNLPTTEWTNPPNLGF